MDATVNLALMCKAARILDQPDVYLAFPAAPVAYKAEDLASVTGVPESSDDSRRLAEFSRLVNMRPDGPLWRPAADRYLWDAYGDVIETAALAKATRSPQEESEYQATLDVLQVRLPDGTMADSDAVVLYNQYRDRWFALLQEYNSAKVEVEFAADAAARAHWTKNVEPLLREGIRLLEEEWAAKGHRAEVDAARRRQAVLAARLPALVWERWSQQFNPDIDAATDPQGGRFFPATYAPFDAVETGGWNRFTLQEAEAEALCAAAPPELRSAFAPGGVDLDVESVSFDFTSVTVSRHWFIPDVLTARFWRYPNAAQTLGWDAYVAALVFARHVSVRLKPGADPSAAPTAATGAAAGPIRFDRRVILQGQVAGPKVAVALPQIQRAAPLTVGVKQGVLATGFGATAKAAAARPMRTDLKVMARPAVAQPAAMIQPKHSTVVEAKMAQRMSVALETRNFRRLMVFPKTPTPLPAPPQKPQIQASPPDELYVLGFICKRLGPCPNPDPTYTW